MKKTFKAFTLVEMLIVMGIVIILMAVGIVAGRFAINRANDVQHQNAADNLYIAAQAYYADYREYPNITSFANATTGCTGEDCIAEYLDEGAFNGGTDATYYYHLGDGGGTNQAVLICVSLGGFDDVNNRGFYCAGNFTTSDLFAPGNNDGGELIVPAGTELTATGDWSNSDKSFDDAI